LHLARKGILAASWTRPWGEAREPTDGRIGTIGIGFEPGAGYLGCLSTIVADLLSLGSPSCTLVFDEFQKRLREFVRSLHRDVVADAFE
jgi:hypothetical protein